MKLKVHEAVAEAKEAQSWVCTTCPKMIEPGEAGPYCMNCRIYWQDVDNGMFKYEDGL